MLLDFTSFKAMNDAINENDDSQEATKAHEAEGKYDNMEHTLRT